MDASTEAQRRRYPGSRPFSKNDEWVFFGRDSEIENLITKINVEKTIVLYGKSGLGKTSLLNAGILPRLEKRYLIIPLRFGTPAPGDIKHPLDILDQQLAELFRRESFLNNIEPEDISLWQHLKNLQIADPDHLTLLLVFDQFEELFTYSRGVDEFAEALAEVLYNRIPKNFQRALRLAENTRATRLSNKELELLEGPIDTKVLMAIRSDRMGLLDRLSFHVPNILKSCYELKHLSQAQAQDAISLPAQRKGQFQSEPFAYQPEALAQMLAYLTQNGETPVESFQLQILCQYVENNIVIRQKKTSVGPDDLGDLETVYHEFYDRTRKALGTEEDQRKAGLLIEEGLIFEKEKRRISLFEGQIENTYAIDRDLLRKIVDTHIIRREPRGGGYIYELSHDSLVAPILKAKKQRRYKEEKKRERQERLKKEEKRREARKQKEKEEKLKLQLAEQKAEFEYQRAEQQAASARRQRRWTIGLGVLVIIVLATAIYTLFLKQEVKEKLFESYANTLAYKAVDQYHQYHQLKGALLARQAYNYLEDGKLLPIFPVEDALRKVFSEPYLLSQELLHEDIVSPVAFSPDGKRMATGSDDKKVRLWNLNSLDSKPQVLKGHAGKIYSLAFSPDGKMLAAAGEDKEDKTVHLWELDKPQDKPTALEGHTGTVWSVAFSPDGKMLAAAGEDKTVSLWDLDKPQDKPTALEGHTGMVWSVAFSPDGKTLASGSKDATIKLWNVKNLDALPIDYIELRGHQDAVLSVAFSPDGKTLASGSYDKTVRLWDLENPGKKPFILEGHDMAVRSLAFRPDGKKLASGSYDKTMRLWDMESPDVQPVVLNGHTDYIFSVAFSHDGKILASGSKDKTVRIWQRNPVYSFMRDQENWNPSADTLAIILCENVARNLTSDEWKDFVGEDKAYQKTCSNLPEKSDQTVTNLLEKGGNLARTGEVEDAIAQFKEAVKLNPKLDINPDELAKLIAARSIVQKGKNLAKSGDITGAIKMFNEAKKLGSVSIPNPKAEAEKLKVEGLVRQGRNLARDGHRDGAIAKFKEAKELGSDSISDPEAETDKLIAEGLVRKGQNLAQEGDLDGASQKFERALNLNPSLKINPEALAKAIAARSFVQKGENLARGGDIKGAVEKFEEAKKIWPDLDLDPKARANKLAAEISVLKGENSARRGDIDSAIKQFNDAQELYPALQITAKSWNALCWDGSLWEKADLVMFACEKAVSLDSKNGAYRDSRGLARALTGNYDSAIEDFNYYVDWAKKNNRPDNFIQKRKDWIQKLETNQSPFDQRLVSELRNE